MLKKKILGKKMMNEVRAGWACCWEPGSGCSCVGTPDNSKFISNSNKWLDRMAVNALSPDPTPE